MKLATDRRPTQTRRHLARRAESLTELVGRALGLASGRAASHGPEGLSTLEDRVMLEGSFATAIQLNFVGGRATGPGLINPAVATTDNDFFRFTPTTTDFVTILADTANETPASVLNTRINVYNEASESALVGTGTNNGTLTSGLQRDGWFGFVAQANTTYYIKVSSDYTGVQPNLTTANTYTLRVDDTTTQMTLDGASGIAREFGTPPPVPPQGPTPILGEIALRQDEIVYRYVAPAAANFDSLVTVNAQSTQTDLSLRLNTRLEVYNSQGLLISSDSDAGRLQDAFTTMRAHPGDTFYVRVRSDRVRDNDPVPGIQGAAQGPFWLVLDASPIAVTLNPVRRQIAGAEFRGGAFAGFGDPTPPGPSQPVRSPTFQTDLLSFTSQGDGLTIITVTPTGLFPVNDPAVRLYDDNGNLLAFNDNFAGTSSELQVRLFGGRRYFVVVDGFEISSLIQYNLVIEANHTFDQAQALDDHIDPFFLPQTPTPADRELQRRTFEQATGLTLGTPAPLLDADQNIVRDRAFRSSAVGTGRIWTASDRDVFQFTAPMDMLSDYAGNNDELGLSLFVGGRFEEADPGTPFPASSRNLAIWDAQDYFFTGAQFFDPAFNVTYGFNDNVATPGTTSAEVYTVFDWNPRDRTAPQGMTSRVVVVGGDFDLIVPGPFGPVHFTNLAVWRQNFNTGRFGWSGLLGGGTDGPVRAITEFLPDAQADNPFFNPAALAPDPASVRQFNIIAPVVNAQRVPYLVIGGQFTDVNGVGASNIATFDFANPDGWRPIGSGTDGPVNAFTIFDPPDPNAERAFVAAQVGPPPTPEKRYVADTANIPTSLIVGGQFTQFDGVPMGNIGLWTGGLDVNNDGVFAPGDLVDARALASGRVGAIPGDPGTPPSVGPFGGDAPPAFETNGPVFSLATFDLPDVDGPALPFLAGRLLVVGGSFTDTGDGGAANNLAVWGILRNGQLEAANPTAYDPTQDPQNPNPPQFPQEFEPQVFGLGLSVGAAGGGVLALRAWDPPDINNNPIAPLLLIGGDFLHQGINHLIGYGGLLPNSTTVAAVDLFGGAGPDLPVRALTTLVDAQEPGIDETLISGAPQEALYIGGDFTQIDLGLAGILPAAHVAQFAARNTDQGGPDFFEWTRMNGGVARAPAATLPAATVFALGAFDDGNPREWDRHDRRFSRLAMTVSPDVGSFGNYRVRVYDSNFNVVYGFGRPGSETISPPFPDPAGMIDPSLVPPAQGGGNNDFEGIKLWGGETYYIEVSTYSGGDDQNNGQGRGTGRYVLNMVVDDVPPDRNGDNRLDNPNQFIIEEPDEGHYDTAYRRATQLPTGDGDNIVNSASQPLAGNEIVGQHIAPAAGSQIVKVGDIGNIHSELDTDLYVFRAEFSGFVEVRTSTFQLLDQYGEQIGTNFAGQTKTYNSALDTAVRIFRNDFTQWAYNDDNSAMAGDVDRTTLVGTLDFSLPDGTPQVNFRRSDSRVVFQVVAGNDYFIQVESGQNWQNGRPFLQALRTPIAPNERDIRHATGAYMLLINQMPQLFSDIENGRETLDDHIDAPNVNENAQLALATPVPIGDSDNTPDTGQPNGRGSITGLIDSTPSNTPDTDVFTWIAPGNGRMTVRVSPTAGSALAPQMFVLSGALLNVAGSPEGNNVFAATIDAVRGQVFHLQISGNGGSEGGYRVDITAPPGEPGIMDIDDHGSLGKWHSATEISLRDFLGQGLASGSIEAPGDTDIYRFRVDTYMTMTINVQSTSATLNPLVTVYEVSEDRAGFPMFMRIGVNNDIVPPPATPPNFNSRVSFPVTPNRVTTVAPPGTDRVYPYYYIVVQGADPAGDFGSYALSLTFPPTDDHADADANSDGIYADGEFALATQLVVDTSTGRASDTGIIEKNDDSDLFSFIAPASGNATVTLTRPASSTMRAKLTLLDGLGNVLGTATGTDTIGAVETISVTIAVVRGGTYFVASQGAMPNTVTTLTGAYTVDLQAPPLDDFPNATEFDLSDSLGVIPISQVDGAGRLGGDALGAAGNARINPDGDTDLFNFTSINDGTYTVTIRPYGSNGVGLAPTVRIFDGVTRQPITATITAGGPLQDVTISFTASSAAQKFYILVGASVPLGAGTGEYAVLISGPLPDGPPPPPPGDDPSRIDFGNPTVVSLSSRTGDGSANDVINVTGDRDLFTFTTTAAGRVYIQIVTPNGSLLDASVRVLSNPNELQSSEVLFNADGVPGATADGSFVATAGKQYWVVVDGLGDSTGSYQLRINTKPVKSYLYYPEGFSNSSVREFISIVNPNSVDVSYTVYLRYEFGADLETVIGNGVVRANSRDGLTLRDGNTIAPGLKEGVPYAVVIESSEPIGATLAHYDFGTSLGDSFSETLASTWQFARVERSPGDVLDFIVFYNPNTFAIDVTLTGYQTGGAIFSMTRTFQPQRRGGFSINDIGELPRGVFSVTLSAQASSSADQPAFQGIVASLSHYNLRSGSAFGALGDAQGGATTGVVTNIAQGSTVSSEITFYNPGTSTATVTLVGSYVRTSSLPQFSRVFDIAPRSQASFSGTALGLVSDQPAGLRWSASQPILAQGFEVQNGDADGTQPATTSALGYYFGDAFINPPDAGRLYFETLYFHNPTNLVNNITVRLVFFDQSTALIPITIAPRGFAELKLHERQEIRGRSGPSWFGVDASSTLPFNATMIHYDLFLGGGWATSGVPVGLPIAMSTIV